MNTNCTLEELRPFGLVVRTGERGANLRSISVPSVTQWIDDHRVLILRGFAPLPGTELPEFARRLGEILEWEFGAVNDLRVRPDARNYLYTNREVPFHWDGAFVGRVPHYILFHCDLAAATYNGGETIFCDTIRLLERAPVERRELWEQIAITYTTEKIVHYGGSFTSPMISSHPLNGEKVLRFAEPVVDLNPVQLEIKGVPREAQAAFLEDMHERLNADDVCYRHEWHEGDVVIADNYVLLHGRRAFAENARRQIRRVNIL
ncbi:MAG TPA: TauD/TfdA family dioxygenase [Pyrinomonadaceae bacterium]